MITQEVLAKVHHHHPHRIRMDRLNAEEQEIFKALRQREPVQDGTLKAHCEQAEYRPRINWHHEAKKLDPEYVKRLEEEKVPPKKAWYLVFE